MTIDLQIERLGSHGDGIASHNGKQVFVPFTLPGEKVKASGTPPRLELDEVVTPSADRIAPVCQHFGVCGGCSLQHMRHEAYISWKRRQIIDTFSYCDLKPELAEHIVSDAGSRRRAVFTFRNTLEGMKFGFLERRSHTIIELQQCPVLVDGITEKLPELARLAALVPGLSDTARMAVLATSEGLDVCLLDVGKVADKVRRQLVTAAIAIPLARLALDDEVLIETVRPWLSAGKAQLTPAPNGFSQPVEKTEKAMVDLVSRHLKKSKSIVDLFSGFGTFALPLAERAKVHAVEHEASALAALQQAASGVAGLKIITTEQRDLYRRPLLAPELAEFTGAVIDPPRAGAERQMEELVASPVSRIAAVSCNPVTLARDVKILVDGGFTLKTLVPVDQFVFSHHIEVVALLERPAAKKQRSIFG